MEGGVLMDPRTWEYLLRLALAALLGGIIGLERESRLKGAGIRTHLIVAFASCMMLLVSKYGFFDLMEYEAVKLDPSRVAAGLVTAIGFLGAGTISFRKRGVMGLSTAAGLWATVGVGMSVGAGMYIIGSVGTVFLVVVQHALHPEHDAVGNADADILRFQIDGTPQAMDQLQASLTVLGMDPTGAKYDRAGGVLTIELQLERLPCSERELGKYLAPLMKQPYVRSIVW